MIVLDVNGRSDMRNPVTGRAGPESHPRSGARGPRLSTATYEPFKLDVKPCTRYYLKAVKKNQLEQDFVPGVDYQEPIAGCTA